MLKSRQRKSIQGGMGEKGRGERQTVKHERETGGEERERSGLSHGSQGRVRGRRRRRGEEERKPEESYLPNGSHEEGRLEERQRKEEERQRKEGKRRSKRKRSCPEGRWQKLDFNSFQSRGAQNGTLLKNLRIHIQWATPIMNKTKPSQVQGD